MANKELNTLLNGIVKIWQNTAGFRVSQDAVILSHIAHANIGKNKKEILDIGCGNGGITLCLAKLFEIDGAEKTFTCIDIQTPQLELLNESITENQFKNHKFQVINENLETLSAKFKTRLFDIVITNPPFYKGLTSPTESKSIAHTQDENFDLYKWIDASLKTLKSNGEIYVIHQADYLDVIIQCLKNNKAGAIEIFPIFSKTSDAAAKRIVIRAKKISNSPTTLHKAICLYDEQGNETINYKNIFNK